jgi:hypothetical protein
MKYIPGLNSIVSLNSLNMSAVLSYMIFHCFFMVAAESVDVKNVVDIFLFWSLSYHKSLLGCLLEWTN